MDDWNNVQVLIEVARTGSFNRAATVLGMDQATVSRRIAQLEARSGVPLFTRGPAGAVPTEAGRRMIDAAEQAAAAFQLFQRTLRALTVREEPVSIAAPEGTATYLLGPAFAGAARECLPLDLGFCRLQLPPIDLLPLGTPNADIEILVMAPGEAIPAPADFRARSLGRMRFVPVATRSYLLRRGSVESLTDLRRHTLLNHSLYRYDAGLAPWNEVVDRARERVKLTAPTSSALYRATSVGAGVSLLPDFSPLMDPDIVALPCGAPPMMIELCAVSHKDTLRNPNVKAVYDALCAMFQGSSWFATD